MTDPTHNLTRHWQALDAAHHIHPFSQTSALNAEGVRFINGRVSFQHYGWQPEEPSPLLE